MKRKNDERERVIWKTPIILKWVFPVFSIGLLSLMVVLELISESPSPVIVLFPVIALAGFGLYAATTWSFVDEVRDCGDYLVFRKGTTRQVVNLEDVVNINADTMTAPVKLTVLTRKAGPLGNSLSFGIHGILPFIKPALLVELISRVDRARQETTRE